jgi:DNA-binding transcriptional MerR regulator
MGKETYTIAQLAKEFDITSRTLRFYEEQGILSPEREGSKRIYSRKDRARIKMILRGKRLGFSIREIREIIEIYNSKTGERKQLELFLETIRQHLVMLENQMEDIRLTIPELKRFEKRCLESLNKYSEI